MKKEFVKIMLAIVTIALFTACNNQEKLNFEAPLPALEPQFTSISIVPDKDSTYVLENGTRLSIQKGSLLDANGIVINEEVELRFRQFDDAVGIFLAGMPMDFNLDKNMALQTAGMFELRGDYMGTPVTVDRDKPISITIGSNFTDTRQGFFKLDETTGQWDLQDIPEWNENEELLALQEEVKTLKPKWEYPLPPNFYVFSHLRMADIFVGDNDWNAIMKMNKKVMKRKMASYGVQELDLDLGWENIKYRNNYYSYGEILWKSDKKITCPKWVKNISSSHYDETSDKYLDQVIIKKKAGDKFLFEFKDYKKDKYFAFELEAVSHIRHLVKYTPEQLIADNERIQNEINEIEERMSKMRLIEYTVDVFEMGIYNCDRPILYREGRPEILVKLDDLKIDAKEIHKMAVFNTDLSSVSYPVSYKPLICPMFKGTNKIIVINKNMEIGLISGNEFNLLDSIGFNKSQLELSFTKTEIKDEAELRELLTN